MFEEIDGSSVSFVRIEMIGFSQDEKADSNNFQCWKYFDFLATVSVGKWGVNRNVGGSTSDGSGI